MILLIPVVIVCAAMLFRATFMPVWVWDSWAIWDLKARAFFVDRSVVPFVSDTYYALSHPDYPLLVPLAGTFMYLLSGSRPRNLPGSVTFETTAIDHSAISPRDFPDLLEEATII